MSKSGKFVLKGIILTNQVVTTIGIGQMMKHLTKDANILAKIGASCVAYYLGKFVSERTCEMLDEIDEM